MEFVQANQLVIRNFTEEDLSFLSSLEASNVLVEAADEIKESFNDDFATEGEKYFAVEINNKLAGMIQVNLDKPYIYFNLYFIPAHYTRMNTQITIFNFIKYVHMLYKHRQIITYTSKFDFGIRSVLENFKFERANYDKIKDIYTYTLYNVNPNK